MARKTIHIELVIVLLGEKFLSAILWFISKSGIIIHLFSEHATNLIKFLANKQANYKIK